LDVVRSDNFEHSAVSYVLYTKSGTERDAGPVVPSAKEVM